MAMDGIDRDNLISAQSYPYLFKPSMSKKATIHDNLIRVSPQKTSGMCDDTTDFYFQPLLFPFKVGKFSFHQSEFERNSRSRKYANLQSVSER